MLTLFHQIFTPANTGFMLKGLGMTIVIAVLAILISMFFGTILALIRTYASGRFKGCQPGSRIYGIFPMHPKPAVDLMDLFYSKGK